MALNAVHIRSRSVSLTSSGGIGFRASENTSASHTARQEYDHDWSTLRTGDPSNDRNLRMGLRFVKETGLSNSSLQPFNEEEPAPLIPSAPVTQPESVSESSSSFSQFYATLAREAPTHTPAAQASHLRKHVSEHPQPKATTHSHHHRHDPTVRHKSDWFVAKALAKLRHTQLSDKGKQKQVEAVAPSATLCPSCGDALPADRTPEAMAQHRQSITHRLGLNAPMSSASASEAPSSAPSEAPTPLYRSRSVSPDGLSAQSARPRSVSRRRLSTAARSKKIQHDNVGYTLLSRMGWKEGMGLGVDEWKWQQLFKEKRRQKLNHIRALLKDSARSGGDTTDTAIIIRDDGDLLTSPELGSDWLQMLPQMSPETADGYHFGDDSLLFGDDDMHNLIFEMLPMEERLALQQAIRSGDIALEDLTVTSPQQSHEGVLVEPIQVDVRPDRRGLGLETHRRRSRTADGAVEIRQTATQEEVLSKKSKASSNPSQYLRPRSRSTKHQRKLAEDRKKRDWLDLRASLS